MESPTKNMSSPPPTTIQFPVNLFDGHDQKRPLLDEMDFFAAKEDGNCKDTDERKEFNKPLELDFNINVSYLYQVYSFSSVSLSLYKCILIQFFHFVDWFATSHCKH